MKKTTTTSNKISLGKKRTGKAKKKFGPKVSRPKAYRGQGR